MPNTGYASGTPDLTMEPHGEARGATGAAQSQQRKVQYDLIATSALSVPVEASSNDIRGSRSRRWAADLGTYITCPVPPADACPITVECPLGLVHCAGGYFGHTPEKGFGGEAEPAPDQRELHCCINHRIIDADIIALMYDPR